MFFSCLLLSSSTQGALPFPKPSFVISLLDLLSGLSVWTCVWLPVFALNSSIKKFIYYTKIRTSRNVHHVGVPNQWNGGHVGVPNQSWESLTLFLGKHFLLKKKKFSLHCCWPRVRENALSVLSITFAKHSLTTSHGACSNRARDAIEFLANRLFHSYFQLFEPC